MRFLQKKKERNETNLIESNIIVPLSSSPALSSHTQRKEFHFTKSKNFKYTIVKKRSNDENCKRKQKKEQNFYSKVFVSYFFSVIFACEKVSCFCVSTLKAHTVLFALLALPNRNIVDR